MRWLQIVLVVIAVAAIAFVPFEKIYDDGLWPLSVTVHSSAGRPIKGFSAEAVLNVENAQQMLGNLLPLEVSRAEKSIYAAVQEPRADEPLVVNVPTSETSHCSLVLTHRRFFQYRGLLVVVEYKGGELEGRAVEIPDLRYARQVAVEVP